MNINEKKLTSEYLEKHSKAQFFTESSLVLEIFKLFNLRLDGLKILEPSCGDCSFIKEITKLNSKNIITAVDIDKKYINKNKKIYNNVVFICDDFLTHNFENNYELIIGNPPFNLKTNTKYKDTTEGFVLKSIDLLKEDGQLVMILPATVLRTMQYQELRKSIIEKCKIEYIFNTNKYDFLGMDFETIALCVRKKKVKSQKYIYFAENTKKTISWVPNKRYTIHLENLVGVDNINKKLSNNTLSDLFEISRGKSQSAHAVRGRDINFFDNFLASSGNEYFIGIQNIAYRFTANVIKGKVDNIKDTITILYPKKNMSLNEMLFYVDYLNSSIANYIIHNSTLNNSRLTIHMDKYYIDDIHVPDSNYENKIINETRKHGGQKLVSEIRNKSFYNILNLDSDFINDIEKNWSEPRYVKK